MTGPSLPFCMPGRELDINKAGCVRYDYVGMLANAIDRYYHLAEGCSRVAVNFRRFISGGKLHAGVHLEVDDGTDGLVDRGNETGQRLATDHQVLYDTGVQELLELLQRFLVILISLIASSDALISRRNRPLQPGCR